MAICNTYLKDYRVALKNIDEFLAQDQNDSEAYFVKGVIDYHLSNYD